MRVRKAVFPAAGWGTRFLPATKAQPKEMLPLVDKPVIQYAVEEAVAAGIEQVSKYMQLALAALLPSIGHQLRQRPTLNLHGASRSAGHPSQRAVLGQVGHLEALGQLGGRAHLALLRGADVDHRRSVALYQFGKVWKCQSGYR